MALQARFVAAERQLARAIDCAKGFPGGVRLITWGSILRPEHFSELPELLDEIDGFTPGMHGRPDELMRFRHFRRYYFHFDYDWDRLEYLIALVRRVAPEIAREFDRFRGYVSELVDRIT